MKVSGHRKQILFFLITIILPSLVLVIFTLRMLRQEKELAQKRDLEERRRIARGIGRNMLLRLEEIRLLAMGRVPCRADIKNICPEIVLIGVVDEDRLLLPWEICTDRGLPQKLLNEPRFREKIGQAERAEFSGNNPAEAARLYARAAQNPAEPVQMEFARLLRARALARAGMKEEARALFSEILSLSSDVRDEFGIPLSYYAGGGLIESGRHHAQVIKRVMQDLQSRDWFSPE